MRDKLKIRIIQKLMRIWFRVSSIVLQNKLKKSCVISLILWLYIEYVSESPVVKCSLPFKFQVILLITRNNILGWTIFDYNYSPNRHKILGSGYF